MQLQRALSIQSCFPDGYSVPGSSEYEYPQLVHQGLEPSSRQVPHQQHVISVPPNAYAAAQNVVRTAFLGDDTATVKNLAFYVPLYQAALKGDWEKAKAFISLHPEAVTARISRGWETALHIAAGAKQTKFVEELLKLMNPKDLQLQNKHGNTALCFAAASGIAKIAELMVIKNNYLPMVRGSKGVTPLHMAALLGFRDMVRYLYLVTDDQSLTKEDYVSLLTATISSDLYDIALHIIQCKPELAIERNLNLETALHVLARKHSVFSCGNELGMWQRCIYPWVRVHRWNKPDFTCQASMHQEKKLTRGIPLVSRLLQHVAKRIGTKEVFEKKFMRFQALELLKSLWKQVLLLDDSEKGNLLRSPSRPLFVAAEFGNFEFIVELLRSYPDLIWKVNDQSQSIFHIAVIHRQERIFKLIYQIGALKDLITSYKSPDNSNMLHLAAKLAPSNRLKIVSGAALQMQRELLWFKEVEKIVQPSYKEMRDSEGQTPRMLFTKEHKSLLKGGERWMKDTASSCMLVATLITTVMFAAIFTIPGGNNNDTGTPIFLEKKSFIIFSVFDALALFSSVTSTLMFLSILTSRYAEEDFLETLPKRLIYGLTTLFFSIASMLIAFSASFSIALGSQRGGIIIPGALCASIPIIFFFVISQFPLVADTIHSTYGSGIFSRGSIDILFKD